MTSNPAPHKPKTKPTTERTTEMKLYISTNDDAYGISTPEQIELVQKRMEIIANRLGIETEYRDNQLGDPDAAHELSEAIFEQAMDCASSCPPELVEARAVADRECPL